MVSCARASARGARIRGELVVVPVAAAGFAVAGAGVVTVGAVTSCVAAVAGGLVHSSYCITLRPRVSTRVEAWLVGWLVGWLWREGVVCLTASVWGERGAWAGGGWVGVCAVSSAASAGVTSRFRVGWGCGVCGLLGGVVLLRLR